MGDRTGSPRPRPRFLRLLIPGLAVAALLGTVSAVAAGPGGASVADVRAATARFHDLAVAEDAGYGAFYMCTDHETPGVGAMGQHYVRGDLVVDPRIDPLRPEALIYAPKPGGGWRLVGVEYVVFQEDWHTAFGDAPPTVMGVELRPMGAPNRYGLPPFYQRHLWLWRSNPSGMTEDWNPNVSCRGTGDPA